MRYTYVNRQPVPDTRENARLMSYVKSSRRGYIPTVCYSSLRSTNFNFWKEFRVMYETHSLQSLEICERRTRWKRMEVKQGILTCFYKLSSSSPLTRENLKFASTPPCLRGRCMRRARKSTDHHTLPLCGAIPVDSIDMKASPSCKFTNYS